MALEYRFSCPLPNGLHARPASILAELASRFAADVRLTNERNQESADAASVLELVAAGVMYRDLCLLQVSGNESEPAYHALVEFISGALADCDSPLPELPASASTGRLPHALAGEVQHWLSGLPAAEGLALAPARILGRRSLPQGFSFPESRGTKNELSAFDASLAEVLAQQESLLDLARSQAEVEIQQALLSLARDPSLHASIRRKISNDNQSAAKAVDESIRSFAGKLSASGSSYLQERSADLEDLGLQLIASLCDLQIAGDAVELSTPCILCAPALATNSMLSIDKRLLCGLVLGESGLTSHTVILARALGIPVVAGVSEFSRISEGAEMFIDGGRGVVIPSPSVLVRTYLETEQERTAELARNHAALASQPGRTADGRAVEIAANIASPDELDTVLQSGAEGIGLFRTEMLFAAAARMPGEDEQAAIYSDVARRLHGQRLIIRTVDVGGDKPLPWLPMAEEENPFLGLRGIRLSMRDPQILRVQLRAVLRATSAGNVWLMAPMVSNAGEMRWFREQLDLARTELAERGQPADMELPVGCMLEVPAAALQVRALAEYCDFFSIGSNDLTQYCLAVDRGNPDVASLHDELHPALLRLMRIACDDARAVGRWIGICGEFAAKTQHAVLLAGLGFDELSMSAPAIPALKQALADCNTRHARELLERCCEAPDADFVRDLLRGGSRTAERPMLATELVRLDSRSGSKALAIRELCGLCLLDDRTNDIDGLEDAVWAREETYSTGLGYGIAIPHCKSEHVSAASLAILKLRQPLEWGSLDGDPVDMVLMLAMPAHEEGNRHLKVFARLARRLMNEEFRSGLRRADTTDNIVRFLQGELRESEE
ncbi:phosphoenolpyruvate--protein phosphotransferase [bacterium]|nr:phosphoenolpyruvate--protein phosphotransferase [bacterium]